MADNGTHEIAFVITTKGTENVSISLKKIEQQIQQTKKYEAEVNAIAKQLGVSYKEAEQAIKKVQQTDAQLARQEQQNAKQREKALQEEQKIRRALAKEKEKSQANTKKGAAQEVSAMKSVGAEGTALTSIFKGLGTAIIAAFGLNAIKDFISSCLELGSALTEVQNVVDVVFGKDNKYIEDFAESALKQFGLMEVSAKRYAGLFGSMAKNSGFDNEQSEAMATQLAGMVGDVTSLYDMEQQSQAFTALMSIFSNNTASLRRSTGIVATQANLKEYAASKGIEKQIKDMTNAEKVALRYSYVMEKLAFAQGDFQRTSGTWANQMRLLKGEWEQFKTVLGQILTEILLPLLKGLNALIQALINATSKLKDFVFTFKGVSDSGITEETANARAAALLAADSMDEYADSIDDVTASAEKLKKTSFGFDNLNKLADPNSGSGKSGGGDPIDIGSLIGDGNVNGGEKENNPFDDITLKIKSWTDGFSDNFKHLLGSMKVWAKEDGENIGRIFKGSFEAGVKTISIGGKIVSGIGETIDKHLPELEKKGQEVHDNLTTPILEGVDEVTEHLNDELDTFSQEKLPGTIEDIQEDTDGGLTIFDELWNKFVTPNLETLKEDIEYAFGENGSFKTGIDRAITNIQRLAESCGWIMDILGVLGGIFSAYIVNQIDLLIALFSGAWQILQDFLQHYVGMFTIMEGIFDFFKGDIKLGLAEIADGLYKMLTGTADAVMQVLIYLLKRFQIFVNDIINAYNSTLGKTIGKNLDNVHFANDLEQTWDMALSDGVKTWDDIVDTLQGTNGIEGNLSSKSLTSREMAYGSSANNGSSTPYRPNNNSNDYKFNITAVFDVDGNELARTTNASTQRIDLISGTNVYGD